MSAKAIVPGALILAVLGGWAARAAEPAPQGNQPELLPPPSASPSPLPNLLPAPSPPPPGPNGPPAGIVPDPWITYTRPDCCGPWGKNGPIGGEVYLRTGPSLPVGGQFLLSALQAGWMVDGGLRTLLFNPSTHAAWTFDVGLSYTYDNGNRPDLTYPLPVLGFQPNPTAGQPALRVPTLIDVSVREYHRSSLNLAAGREWYPFKPAYSPGWNYRIGFDTGGRWGASRVNLNYAIPNEVVPGFLHRYDVYGAVFVSLHNDLEIPCGCGKFIAGFRAEWNYNWSDILLTQRSDLQDVNLLLNFGYRY